MSRYEKFTSAGVKMYALGPASAMLTYLNREELRAGTARWRMRAIRGDDDHVRYMLYRLEIRDGRLECAYLTGTDPVQVTWFAAEE